MWLKNSTDKLLSSDVVMGSTLIIPVDVQDEGEITNDAWVTSSNWYFCYAVRHTSTPLSSIKSAAESNNFFKFKKSLNVCTVYIGESSHSFSAIPGYWLCTVCEV